MTPRRSRGTSTEEFSAGGVVVRGREVIVIVPARRSSRGAKVLGLPKGHPDGGETADQLRRGRKTATIRLGDKSHKYRKNECVLVTIGYQHSPREKIFNAVIDQVEVKPVKDLSPRDIEHDNPEFRRVDEMVHFLEQIYGRKVSLEDTVTVVRFSQIVENPPELRDRIHGLGSARN